MSRIGIIIGSTRDKAAGQAVGEWVNDVAQGRQDGVEYELLELKKFNVPLLTSEVVPGAANKQYDDANVQEWSKAVDACDGFVFVTPEYNHSVSAVLKNAIDYLPPVTLKDKAVGLVGYSWYGAATPLEHLREIVSTFGADVRGRQVGINLGSDFQDGVFKPSDELNAQIRELLASLA